MISEEEQKIRADMEADIEQNLEEELKDRICHLVLSLHRFYLHKNKPTLSSTAETYNELKANQGNYEVTTVVKITTTTVGEHCMMQMYESKINVGDFVLKSCANSPSKVKQGKQTNPWKASTGSNVATGKKRATCSSEQYKCNGARDEGGNCSNTITRILRKPNQRNKTKLLELGWKY